LTRPLQERFSPLLLNPQTESGEIMNKPIVVARPIARSAGFAGLLAEVRGCTLCTGKLPLPPRPILQFDPRATILIAGQAPGRKAHDSGIPFSDASGNRLRAWMGMDRAAFYDAARVAILPMGFCFPGTGAGGDVPPRPECAPAWRERLLAQLPRLQLTLVIGGYAQAWHLMQPADTSVTAAVSAWREHWPNVVPLPHPSPRNQRWLRNNPWFEHDVLPRLRERIGELL
jgi:uracil-DNA glycosylase